MTDITKTISAAYLSMLQEKKKMKDKADDVEEDNSNDKSDDGEGLDKVQPKAVKKKFDDRKDKDIDNDGDTDSSDEYLHKRRKAISKDMKKDEKKEVDEAKRKGAPKMTGDSVAIQRAKDAELNKALGRTKTGRKKPERNTSTKNSLASLRKENNELEEATKYGIIRYPDTAISYVKNTGKGWEHMYDPSYGFKGKVDSKDMKHMSSIDPKKVPGRLMKNESLDENKHLATAGTKETIMNPKTKISKKVDKSEVRKYVQQGWMHMGPKKNRITKEEVEGLDESAKRRALASIKAQPKDKVSLKKAPWDKKDKKEEAETDEMTLKTGLKNASKDKDKIKKGLEDMRNRLKNKKEEVSEAEGEMTDCPKCEGSTENHSPDCPTQKETKSKDDTAVVSPKAEAKKWTVYKRIMEKTKADQTANAVAGEEIDSKESEGSKKFADAHDTPPSDVSDVEKAIEKNLKTMSSDPIKHAPLRGGENRKEGK